MERIITCAFVHDMAGELDRNKEVEVRLNSAEVACRFMRGVTLLT